MGTNNQVIRAQEQIEPPRRSRFNPLRALTLVIAAVIIGFGALLIEDGLTDAENRHPAVKRHIDRKEIAIATPFILGGFGVVALSCVVLRPRYKSRAVLKAVCLAMAYAFTLALLMKAAGIQFNKPKWFTSNVPVKVPTAYGEMRDYTMRERALVESLSETIRQNK